MSRISRFVCLLLCLFCLVSCAVSEPTPPAEESGAAETDKGDSPAPEAEAETDPSPEEEEEEAPSSPETEETPSEEEKEEAEGEAEEEKEPSEAPEDEPEENEKEESEKEEPSAPAAPHTCSFIKTSETKATCEKEGVTVYTCSCGAVRTETAGSMGHSFSDWKTTKAPTATSTGTKTRTCSRCGKTESQTIPKISVPSSAPAFAAEVLRLVNEERAAAGLPALTYYAAGQEAADIRAMEYSRKRAHTRPDGREWYTVWDDLSLGDYLCAENLAGGQTSPATIVQAWMNSPAHRDNILYDYPTALVFGQYDEGISYYSLLFVAE